MAQWWGRYPHDPEFGLFRSLKDASGLVLDVGAHRGQSAVSVLRQTRRLKVLSCEPNPAAHQSLRLLRCLHPRRFRFSPVAAGATDGTARLWLPGVEGSGLSTQASLSLAEFERPLVQARLAEQGVEIEAAHTLRQATVSVRGLDGLLSESRLEPDIIKIDVEGYEADVLSGLENTLKRRRPVLLIEVNAPQRWWPSLSAMGYQAYRYSLDTARLVPASDFAGILNLWCLHPDSELALCRQLRARALPDH